MDSELRELLAKTDQFPSASTFARVVDLAKQRGDKEALEGAIAKWQRAFPRQVEPYLAQAEEQRRANHWRAVLTTIDQAIAKTGERTPTLHQMAAEAARNLSDDAREISALRALAKLGKADDAAASRLKDLEARAAAGPALAGRNATQQLDLRTTVMDLVMNARINADAGDLGSAREDLLKALAYMPEHPDANFNLARVYGLALQRPADDALRQAYAQHLIAHLQKAVAGGFKGMKQAGADPAFAAVASYQPFTDLVKA